MWVLFLMLNLPVTADDRDDCLFSSVRTGSSHVSRTNCLQIIFSSGQEKNKTYSYTSRILQATPDSHFENYTFIIIVFYI